MSLVVWLPLNGDLTQQGLSDVQVTNNGATVSNDGKIGKSYLFSNSTSSISIPSMILSSNTPEWSFSCWFNLTNDTSTAASCLFSERTGANQTGYTIFLYPSSGQMLVDDGARWTVTPMKFTAGTWYHLTVTRNLTGKEIYVNGVQKASTTTIGTTTGCNTNGCLIGLAQSSTALTTGNQGFNGKLNDVRIYDHALSAKEVKEISKGLVLHYKLNDSYFSKNENIMPNYLEMALESSANASTGTWRVAGSNSMTKTRVLIFDSPEGECYGFQNVGIQTPNDGSCYGIDSFPLSANTVYTISMWARCISGSDGYAGFAIYDSTEKGGSHTGTQKNYKTTPLPATGEWVKCWYTFTTGASSVRNIYIGIVTGEISVITQMCCVHIEKIDNTLDNIIFDNSGFNYNGEIINSLIISGNTIKYNNCTFFNGTDSGILIENLNIGYIINTAITYSFWIKPNGENGARSVYFGSYSGTSWSIEKTAGNVLRLYWNGSPDITTTLPITDGQWQHIVITKNGTTDVKVYLNGVLKQSLTNTHNNLTFPTLYRIGRDVRTNDGTPYKGLMSDFRIYATALSAEDVLELYHTSASIDNKGNLFCGEVVE